MAKTTADVALLRHRINSLEAAAESIHLELLAGRVPGAEELRHMCSMAEHVHELCQLMELEGLQARPAGQTVPRVIHHHHPHEPEDGSWIEPE